MQAKHRQHAIVAALYVILALAGIGAATVIRWLI
jgi:uncharacterized membrane protein